MLHDPFTHESICVSAPITLSIIYLTIIHIYTHAVAEFFFVNETITEVDEAIQFITLCTELGGAALSQNITIQLMATPSTTAQR